MTALARLDNGVHILTHSLPGRQSATVGAWVSGGVRGEGPTENGLAHLLEHLLYRRHRSRHVAFGDEVNACTGREWTVFHGTVPARCVTEMTGLFAATLAAPTAFGAEDLEAERLAVLQEAFATDHDPGAAAAGDAADWCWPGHPISRPIIGDPALIRGVDLGRMHRFAEASIRGSSLLVVAVGAVDHEAIVEACHPLEALPDTRPAASPPPRFGARDLQCSAPGLDRTRLCWLMPAPALSDPEHNAFLLGEGMSTGAHGGALTRALRDRLGLVYGIHSTVEAYSDCGLWRLWLECDPAHARTCRRAVEDCMAVLCGPGPTEEALQSARECLLARVQVEDDDTRESMQRIAGEFLARRRVRSLDERLAAIASIGAGDVRSALASAWCRRAHLAWGPPAALRQRA